MKYLISLFVVILTMTLIITSCNKQYRSKSHDYPKGTQINVEKISYKEINLDEINDFPDPVDYDDPRFDSIGCVNVYRVKFYV